MSKTVVVKKLPYGRIQLAIGRALGWFIKAYEHVSTLKRFDELNRNDDLYAVDDLTAKLSSTTAAAFSADEREALEAKLAQARERLATSTRYVAGGRPL